MRYVASHSARKRGSDGREKGSLCFRANHRDTVDPADIYLASAGRRRNRRVRVRRSA
jgi:hypothetical protein